MTCKRGTRKAFINWWKLISSCKPSTCKCETLVLEGGRGQVPHCATSPKQDGRIQVLFTMVYLFWYSVQLKADEGVVAGYKHHLTALHLCFIKLCLALQAWGTGNHQMSASTSWHRLDSVCCAVVVNLVCSPTKNVSNSTPKRVVSRTITCNFYFHLTKACWLHSKKM